MNPSQPLYLVKNYTYNFRKDFDVMFGQEEATTSAFTLLATACRDLMHVSIQIKSSRPSIISSKRLLYCKLLWSESIL